MHGPQNASGAAFSCFGCKSQNGVTASPCCRAAMPQAQAEQVVGALSGSVAADLEEAAGALTSCSDSQLVASLDPAASRAVGDGGAPDARPTGAPLHHHQQPAAGTDATAATARIAVPFTCCSSPSASQSGANVTAARQRPATARLRHTGCDGVTACCAGDAARNVAFQLTAALVRAEQLLTMLPHLASHSAFQRALHPVLQVRAGGLAPHVPVCLYVPF